MFATSCEVVPTDHNISGIRNLELGTSHIHHRHYYYHRTLIRLQVSFSEAAVPASSSLRSATMSSEQSTTDTSRSTPFDRPSRQAPQYQEVSEMEPPTKADLQVNSAALLASSLRHVQAQRRGSKCHAELG